MSTRQKPRDTFDDDEHGTAKRDYPPGFVEGRGDQATARIPREDLDRLLRRESGTRPKVSVSTEPSVGDEPARALESGTHLRPGAKPRSEAPLTKPTPLAVLPSSAASPPKALPAEDLELPPPSTRPSLERRALVWTLAAIVGLAVLVAAWAWLNHKA